MMETQCFGLKLKAGQLNTIDQLSNVMSYTREMSLKHIILSLESLHQTTQLW